MRALLVCGLTVLLVLIAVGIDGLVLYSGISRIPLVLPTSQEGATWVMVGSDSRAALPPGPHYYGSVGQSPGAHADAVIVLHQGPTGSTILSLPRDVLVSPAPGEISRLTFTFDQGPQQLVNGLCRSLNIPTTHLVVITMNGFAAAVDAVGGVTITNSAPTRDLWSGLDLMKTGRLHLDGTQALALVRSRSPQTLTATGWVQASAAAGDADRTKWLGAMFHALADQAQEQRNNPVALQRLAWKLTGALTIDNGTGLLSLMRLNLRDAVVKDLPVRVVGANGIGATVDAATYSMLASVGYTQPCHTG
jgi:LCP family protein required for cell wall assembly